MSFLQKLKHRDVRFGKRLFSSDEEMKLNSIMQLDVDVCQAANQIIVYAQVPGAGMSDIHVSIEGDADVIIIEGSLSRPENLAVPKEKSDGAFFTKECIWGEFYRRIILPESVDIEHSDAKIKNGVLILVLPLLQAEEKKKLKLKITQEKRRKRM